VNRPDPIEICLESLRTGLRNELHYHTLDHTLMVMKTAEIIAEAMGINLNERTLLRLGAAAHDCGYLLSIDNHEEAGCRWIEPLLLDLNYSPGDINKVQGMIMATKIPQSPRNTIEEILCDADLAYIGTNRYEEISNRLFLELKALGRPLTDIQWLDIQIGFLKNHVFFTEYAQKHWNQGKQKVLENLEKKRKETHP
jgi:uncharacterized protein